MNLKPKEIIPSKENPFGEDLLKRERYANTLTQIIKNTDGGFTLSINADWGYGKTTFVKMWEASLRKEGFQTIYFNAWETDFVADPMLALIDGLRNGVKEEDLPAEKYQFTKAFWTAAIKLVKLVPQWRVIGEITEAIHDGIKDCKKDENELQQNVSYKKLITDFRDQLAAFAKEIGEEKPLIIFVDELDRCRPDYAVQMLERIKHFFAIDNIIFVLSVDKSVICESIKAIYGGLNIDTEAYLRRFIDLEFTLPEPDISDFVSTQYEQKELDVYFTNYWDTIKKSYGGEDHEQTLQLALADCFLSQHRSLRDIEKYFNRLGIIFSSKELPHSHCDLIAYTLYLYMFHRDIYDHLRKVDIDIKDMWTTIEAQIKSTIMDERSESFRRYMGMAISTFGAYIDLVDRKNGYRHEIINDDTKLEWFPKNYIEWLYREINHGGGEVLSMLCDHIELLKETFNWERAE